MKNRTYTVNPLSHLKFTSCLAITLAVSTFLAIPSNAATFSNSQGYSSALKQELSREQERGRSAVRPFFGYEAALLGPAVSGRSGAFVNKDQTEQKNSLSNSFTLGTTITPSWSIEAQTRFTQNFGSAITTNTQLDQSQSQLSNLRFAIRKTDIFHGSLFQVSSRQGAEIPVSKTFRDQGMVAGLFIEPSLQIDFPNTDWTTTHDLSLRGYLYRDNTNDQRLAHLYYTPGIEYHLLSFMSLGTSAQFDMRWVQNANTLRTSSDEGYNDTFRVGPIFRAGSTLTVKPALQFFLTDPQIATANATLDLSLWF